MTKLICSLTTSLCLLASSGTSQQAITIDGTEVPLSELMTTCQTMADASAQVACFANITQLLTEQSAEAEEDVSVPDALSALRTAAQYQDDETGLTVIGEDCRIQIVYYGNYFHISRRNISTIDLISVQFDASQLLNDQTTQNNGGQALFSKGVLADGAAAVMHGGIALDSAQQNFVPRSARMTIGDYATEVIGQIPASENNSFDFVLIHPQRSQTRAEIWDAFEAFVKACQQ